MKFHLRHEPEPLAFDQRWQPQHDRRTDTHADDGLRRRIRELEQRLDERDPSLPSADPLTGLGNGAYLWLEARKLAADFARTGRQFTLVVVDAGDTGPSFQRMRETLLRVSRTEDTVGLLGGPYFGVLITHEGGRAGERFIERVATADAWQPGEAVIPARPTFGHATWSAEYEGSLELLLEAAEADLQKQRAGQHYEEDDWTPTAEHAANG